MQGQNLTLKPFLYIKSSSSYSLHSMHTKKSPTDYADSHRFLLTQEHLNICGICGRTFIRCLRSIRPQITRIYTDFCYSRTSVNICGICGKIFISCLKGNLPQITQINTDFNCISCICVDLRDLWEIPFYAAEIR